MERKQPTAEVIDALEKLVQSRIEILGPHIDKLLRNKRLLRKYQDSQVSIYAQRELAARSSKEPQIVRTSSTSAEEDKFINDFDKLDGILSLAKEIRATSNKSAKATQQDSLKDKQVKTGGRQSLRDALLIPKEAEKVPSLGDDAARLASPEESFLNDVHEQLLYLSRNRITLSPSKLYMNRIKYCKEGKFLTKLMNRSEQPQSVLFQSIFPSLPLMNASEKEEAHLTSPLASADSFVLRLAQQFRSLIVSYERYMKVRVSHETFKVSQLTIEDKKSMIAMWMRGRKLLDLYQHYQKTRQKLPCTCESCNLTRKNQGTSSGTAIATVEQTTPFTTPLPWPNVRTDADSSSATLGHKGKGKSKPLGGASDNSNAWAKSCKPRVEAFHEAYQSKILLLAESAVGQEQLKGTIQALKACCEESASRAKLQTPVAGVGSADSAFVSRWAESLKQFRLVYSILLNEAQELNHCMFINKA